MTSGGWSKFHVINQEEKDLFEKGVNLMGVTYEPIACATQVVAGTNYKYLCNATLMINPPRDYLAKVSIYQPLEGDPIITYIEDMDS